VFAPGSTDVILVFPDQRFGRPNLAVAQTVILRQFDLRLKPELGFAVRAVHVYVKAGFFAREEKKRKPSSRKMVGLTSYRPGRKRSHPPAHDPVPLAERGASRAYAWSEELGNT